MSDAAVLPSSRAEAARYALLRRLAPCMRHHLVVNLQPIGMVHELMERRLQSADPDLEQLRSGAHRIHGLAKAALQSCLDVVTWVAPAEQAGGTVREAVAECVQLVGASLGFRGFAVRDRTGDVPGTISRPALRCVLTGTLLHLSDEASSPGELVVTAQGTRTALVLQVELRPGARTVEPAHALNYRLLGWDDVEALARSDGVVASREGARVELAFPWYAEPA